MFKRLFKKQPKIIQPKRAAKQKRYMFQITIKELGAQKEADKVVYTQDFEQMDVSRVVRFVNEVQTKSKQTTTTGTTSVVSNSE